MYFITNSKGLNQFELDIAGLLPVVGEVAGGGNGLIQLEGMH